MMSLEYTICNGTLVNMDEWTAKDAIVELQKAIVSEKLNKCYGWELRLLVNYSFILRKSTDLFTDFFTEGQFIVDLLRSLEIKTDLLGYDFNFDYIIKAMYFGLLVRSDTNRDRIKHQIINGPTAFRERYIEYAVDYDLHPEENFLIKSWLDRNPRNLHLISLYLGFDDPFRHPTGDVNLTTLKALIVTDRLDLLGHLGYKPFSKELTQLIVDRVYANKRIYTRKLLPIYKHLIELGNLQIGVAKDLMIKHPTIFSPPQNFAVEELDLVCETGWKIANYKPELQAYYLGFPIHLGLPGIKAIKQAIFRLRRVGIVKYAQEMCLAGSRVTGIPEYESIDPSAIEDSLLATKCDTFGPFDRIQFVDDGHVFEFDRDSWHAIFASNPSRNPYTRNPLSLTLIDTIASRSRFAKLYHFPKAKALSDLLTEILNPLPEPEVRISVEPDDGLSPFSPPIGDNRIQTREIPITYGTQPILALIQELARSYQV